MSQILKENVCYKVQNLTSAQNFNSAWKVWFHLVQWEMPQIMEVLPKKKGELVCRLSYILHLWLTVQKLYFKSDWITDCSDTTNILFTYFWLNCIPWTLFPTACRWFQYVCTPTKVICKSHNELIPISEIMLGKAFSQKCAFTLLHTSVYEPSIWQIRPISQSNNIRKLQKLLSVA